MKSFKEFLSEEKSLVTRPHTFGEASAKLEGQSMSSALKNSLSKPEPGSKLDRSIKSHNRAIKLGFPKDHPDIRTTAPDGHRFDKKGMIRLGEDVQESIFESEIESEDGLSGERKEYHDVLTKHGFTRSHSETGFGGSDVYQHPRKGVAKLSHNQWNPTVQHASHPPKDAAENHMTTYERFESDRRPAHFKNGPRDLDDHLKKL